MSSTGVRRVLASALVALAVSACGSSSEVSPPSGVDELTIPTPSPDPDDFVDRIDNPWFPLRPGTMWTYDVSAADGNYPKTVTVIDRTQDLAGVNVTVVESVGEGETVTDLYAQDTSGNVWWFGRAGEWEAGVDGAEAGLVMAATPRVGDGYRVAYVDGVVEDWATVLTLDGKLEVAYGAYDGVLVTEESSTLASGVHRLRYYAQGVGLVYQESVDEQAELAELAEP